ncbi:MAG TPA: hypothetical protein VH208_11050 [Myxococcaceae bacterium]|nr:hypothetical protein [Myxococcaceae bacterium]
MPDSSDSEHKPAASAEPAPSEEEAPESDVNNPGDVWDLGAESGHKSDAPGGGGYLSPAADPSIQIGPLAMVIITVLIGLAILLPILMSKQSIFSSREPAAAARDGGS